MIELLRRVRDEDPERIAVIGEAGATSYAALTGEAEELAAGLRQAGLERFALVTYDVTLIVAVLAASSLTGVEACVYAPDASPEEIRRQAAALDHTVLLTTRDDIADALAGELDVRRPDALRATGSPVDVPPQRRPLLVLTTGTTGLPRGVRHDWARQLSRVPATPQGAGQRWLLVYGPNQFAGLQVLIHVLGAGATLVAPPVRRPKAVKDDLYDHAVTHISATPTFWRFLLAELRSDGRPMPALRQITLGGEAAPASLLDQLEEAFPDARISHVYAGSEFGSTGSVSDRRNGLPVSLLERDEEGHVGLRVEDGQLFVRSSAAMLGYYGEDDLPASDWWPTGDLVEIVDGRIEFRGRASDVVNVGGVKVHPLPVEERVAGVPGVRAARVYGRANALVGAVVAVDVVTEPGADEAAVKLAVKAACADLPRPAQPRSVRIVDDLAIRGGKTVRGSE
ncbi:MAG TPA: class I adenylate-forming enzyme family protein [Nocardioides sp.]|nr:class I adenylate-forming enzyme family protein [Nocardioides sp.]